MMGRIQADPATTGLDTVLASYGKFTGRVRVFVSILKRNFADLIFMKIIWKRIQMKTKQYRRSL